MPLTLLHTIYAFMTHREIYSWKALRNKNDWNYSWMSCRIINRIRGYYIWYLVFQLSASMCAAFCILCCKWTACRRSCRPLTFSMEKSTAYTTDSVGREKRTVQYADLVHIFRTEIDLCFFSSSFSTWFDCIKETKDVWKLELFFIILYHKNERLTMMVLALQYDETKIIIIWVSCFKNGCSVVTHTRSETDASSHWCVQYPKQTDVIASKHRRK